MSSEKRGPVVIERTYRARPDELWDLWMSREGFASWWGPQGFRVEVHAFEPRAGGKLHYDMIASSPEIIAAMKAMGQPVSHPAHATFSKVEPKTRLEITNVIDFIPGVAPYESIIHVELIPGEGTTRMRVTLSPMHDAATDGMQKEGFTSQLTKLDARFAAA